MSQFSPLVCGLSILVVIAGGCRSAPEELTRPDASPAPAPTSSAAASLEDAGEADGGLRATLHEFCTGAFLADQDRLRDKCAPADLDVTLRMDKAAVEGCAKDLMTAIGRSRADFDAEVGKQCADMLRQKDLAQTSETDTIFQHTPCDRVLVGKQAEGSPCLFSVECKDGLACVGYRIGVDGTCKKPPKAGEACTLQPYGSLFNQQASALHHPACAPGAFCDGSTCQPRVAAAKACTVSDACPGGLSCVMGKCGQRAAAGSACAKATDCAFGLRCDRSGDGGGGKCVAKGSAGQDCMSQDECKGRCEMPKSQPRGGPPAPGKCAAVCGSG
jgi:hypothetical protein